MVTVNYVRVNKVGTKCLKTVNIAYADREILCKQYVFGI